MADQDDVTLTAIGETLLAQIFMGAIAAIPWVLFWSAPFRLKGLPDIDVHVHVHVTSHFAPLEALRGSWRAIEDLPQLPKEVLRRIPMSIAWFPAVLGYGACIALFVMFAAVFGREGWISKRAPGELSPIIVNASLVAWSFIALIGCFAACYAQISAEHHDCFRLTGGRHDVLRHAEAAYFAITTFTTTGFGDITASSKVCRLVVAGQTLVGFLVITLVISGFTGRVIATLHREASQDGRRSGGDPER